MQRVAIQNLNKKKRSRSPWDDFTRLSYAHRHAIADLIGNFDNVLDATLGDDNSYYDFEYPLPRLLSVETKWDRRTTFSKVLKGLNFFRRRVSDIQITHPQLRVVLGCAPTIHHDDDRYSSEWEHHNRRNLPPRARYAPTKQVGFDPGRIAVDKGAPIDAYRNYRRNSEMRNPDFSERHPVSDSDEDYVIQDVRFPRPASYERLRPDPVERDNISPVENRKERKKPSGRRPDPVEEDDISMMEYWKERRKPRHGQETSRDRMYDRQEKREIERAIKRREGRERPTERYYDDSYGPIRPVDSRSITNPLSSARRKRGSTLGFSPPTQTPGESHFGHMNQNPQLPYHDRRDMLPSRMSFPITTKDDAFAPRPPSYDQPPRRQDTYSSRRRDQSLQITDINKSSKNRREPRNPELSYNNGDYDKSTFGTMILHTQVPPSRESKIQVAEDLLRYWTTVFDIIGEKVRDRVLDQQIVSHPKPNSTVTPFPKRPDAASASANPTSLNDHTARRGEESPPRRRSPPLLAIEDVSRREESVPMTVSPLPLTVEQPSDDESSAEDESGDTTD